MRGTAWIGATERDLQELSVIRKRWANGCHKRRRRAARRPEAKLNFPSSAQRARFRLPPQTNLSTDGIADRTPLQNGSRRGRENILAPTGVDFQLVLSEPGVRRPFEVAKQDRVARVFVGDVELEVPDDRIDDRK